MYNITNGFLVLFFSLMTLLQPSAYAVIFSGQGLSSGQILELENKTHEAGKAIPAACAVFVTRLEANTQQQSLGSGVLIHKTAQYGYVLTAGHVINKPNVLGVNLNFDPNAMETISKSIPVEAIFLHPEAVAAGSNGRIVDLAIVRFDISLLKRTIEPLELYDGVQYDQKQFLESVIVGFGGFGLNTDSSNIIKGRVHSGKTFAHFDQIKPGFPLSGKFSNHLFLLNDEDPNSKNPIPTARYHQFDPNKSSMVQNVKTHKQQALLTGSDSGSPLLFQSGGQLKVAGIASCVSSGIFVAADQDLHRTIYSVWEPVKQNLNWIREVLVSD